MLDFGGAWDWHLPLIKFAYNKSINQAFRWLHMRLCMGGDAGHSFVGMLQEKGNY